jgi:hypothetical protein
MSPIYVVCGRAHVLFTLFVGRLMFYLCNLCRLACSGVLHILCCFLVLFFFVLCTLCCQFLWIDDIAEKMFTCNQTTMIHSLCYTQSKGDKQKMYLQCVGIFYYRSRVNHSWKSCLLNCLINVVLHMLCDNYPTKLTQNQVFFGLIKMVWLVQNCHSNNCL